MYVKFIIDRYGIYAGRFHEVTLPQGYYITGSEIDRKNNWIFLRQVEFNEWSEIPIQIPSSEICAR
jgi:hypothetical protein